MASCVSPPPQYLAFLPVHMLYWRPSFFCRREQRGEGATGQMKECETRKISYLIQRKTRRSTVASKTAMVVTATIA
jgi:hypothetical protein